MPTIKLEPGTGNMYEKEQADARNAPNGCFGISLHLSASINVASQS
jgi:hypothetical protein